MKNPVAKYIRKYTLVPWLLLALLLSYSTLPTAQPAKDMKYISGKWEGWGSNPKYGRFFITLVIRENGDWQMKMDVPYFKATQFSGKAWLADGKLEVFTENPQLRGAYTLHSKEEKRWLVFLSDDGDTKAELVPSFR